MSVVMLLDVAGVLSHQEVAKMRSLASAAAFIDGGATAGKLGPAVKQNQQVRPGDENAAAVVALVGDALLRREEFTGVVFPRKLHLNFNRYTSGMYYGRHNDAAVVGASMADAVRTDVSFTVFLTNPDDYDGGEMLIQTPHGEEEVKLPAGDAIVYEGSTVHEVRPVTRGERLACFGWAQSLIRDPRQRDLLARFRRTRMDIVRENPDSGHADELGNLYNNLYRMWAEP